MLVIKEQHILKELKHCYIELITIAYKEYFIIAGKKQKGFLYITPAEPDIIKQYTKALELLTLAENNAIERSDKF